MNIRNPFKKTLPITAERMNNLVNGENLTNDELNAKYLKITLKDIKYRASKGFHHCTEDDLPVNTYSFIKEQLISRGFKVEILDKPYKILTILWEK